MRRTLLLKKIILHLFILSGSFIGYGQTLNGNVHYIIGPVSNAASLSSGETISWSVGETVVFNDAATVGTNTPNRFSIAQAMQSYPTSPVIITCPVVTVTPVNSILCGSLNSLELKCKITNAVDTSLIGKDIQWYFTETSTADTTKFSKIVGATLPSFKPLFPGFYTVRIRFTSSSCMFVFAGPNKVDIHSTTVNPPTINANGVPASLLNASADNKMTLAGVQWYAYIGDPLNRYLLVAGATTNDIKVRYDAIYMVIATYTNGCRLSNTHTVSGYGTPLERAADTRLDGNSIFIPDGPVISGSSLSVFPNPAISQFVVHYQSSSEISSKAELYSNTGVYLRAIEFNEGGSWDRSARVSTDGLNAGIYFLKVSEEGKSLVQKVLIYK